MGTRCEAYLRVRRSAARARGVPVRRMGLGRWAFFSSLLGQEQMIVAQYPEGFEARSTARGSF